MMTFSKRMTQLGQKFNMFRKQTPNTKCVERRLICLNSEDGRAKWYALNKANSISISIGSVLINYYQKTDRNREII